MENLRRAKLLLNEMAGIIGMQALDLDEDNYCGIVMENQDVLHMKYLTEQNSIVILGSIGDYPEEDIAEEVLSALLKANFLWGGTDGATLAIEPESKGIILQQEIYLAELSANDVAVHVLEFANFFAAWQEELQNILEEAGKQDNDFDLE